MKPITFSTLTWPHWQIETVIAKAAEFGYDRIQWRGGSQGHIQPSAHNYQGVLSESWFAVQAESV